MIRIFFLISILYLWPYLLSAQDYIEADRPGETQSAATLSKNHFQLELGFQKEKMNSVDYFIQHPNVLLRFGLYDRFELRALVLDETKKITDESQRLHGLEPVEVGFKLKILNSETIRIKSSLLAHFGLPFLSSKDYKTSKAYHKIRLLVDNEINDKIKIGYNIGSEWNDEEHQQNWLISYAPQFKVSDHLQFYIEEFSRLQNHCIPQHHLQGGLAYSVKKNIQLDASSGFGLNSHSPDYFINGGISFRFGK